jgi:GNAT superfamily N-acetyltransferase
MQALAASGFYFVEATICPHIVLDKSGALRDFAADPGSFLPARHSLADFRTVSLERTDAALRAAVRGIAGESFSDDRFHGDHNCGQGVADRRFQFWVDDLTGDPGVAFDILLLRERPIGFMARRAEDLILAGFARKFTGAGLGDFLWLSVLRKLKEAGLNQARSLISVRNIPVLNLYARLGFKFRDPRATFHYWRRLDPVR